jgi:hypothetical protein
MRDSIVLFNNPLGVNIEDQPTQFQLELRDLQKQIRFYKQG